MESEKMILNQADAYLKANAYKHVFIGDVAMSIQDVQIDISDLHNILIDAYGCKLIENDVDPRRADRH